MVEVLQALLDAAENGQAAALVTPVMTEGSLPTRRSSRMAVRQDGASTGTVGGGKMEAEAREAAVRVALAGRPERVHFVLSADEAMEDGLLCGGEASFFVEPVMPGAGQDVFQEMARVLQARTPALEAVRLCEGEPVCRMVVGPGGKCTGSLGRQALDRQVLELAAGAIREDVWEILKPEGEDEVFLNALLPGPAVYIFGGGHVGLAVARIAPTADFRVVVLDDRPAFASRQRFPWADEVRVVAFEQAFEGLVMDELSFVVVLTRGHRWDREVVAQALRTNAAYIGMIGSRRKVGLTRDALRSQGFTDADLDRIHAPIGLPIGGDTPGEIAISIVAELVRVRRLGEPERTGGRPPGKAAAVPWDVLLGGCQ